MKPTNLLLAIISLVLVSLLLAGCGAQDEAKQATNSEVKGDNDQAQNEEETEVETVPETRIISHYMGETEIPAEPKRIAVIGNQDPAHLIALGVLPIASISSKDNEFPPYIADQMKDVINIGSGANFNFEALLQAEPDLIVSEYWLEDQYDQLSKIAPTVLIDTTESVYWYEKFLKYGEIVGKPVEAEQVLADYEEKAAAAKEKLAQAIGDETVMLLRVRNKNLSVQLRGARGVTLHHELGLNHPSGVPDEEKFMNFSMEGFLEINPDHIFLQVDDNEDAAKRLEEIKNSSIWSNLTAVQKDQVYPVDYRLWINGADPIASSIVIDEILEVLVKD